MLLNFLGSGAAFTLPPRNEDGTPAEVRNWQSNLLLTAPNGETILIDCGSDIRHSMWEQRLNHRHVGGCYITHPHADHIGGLEWLAFSTRFDPGYKGLGADNKPILWVPRDFHSSLWKHSLQGGLKATHGQDNTIHDFFDLRMVDDCFAFGGIEFATVPVDHIQTGDWTLRSHGLRFQVNGRTIYFTGDASNTQQLLPFYEGADLIFQDCEVLPFRTQVHAHFEDLANLPVEIRNRMYLYGFQPGPKPDPIAHGFRGFVQPGQSFDLRAKKTF